MGSMNIKMKIMPESIDSDLEKIKSDVKAVIGENQGKGVNFEEEPIAFGLKALIVMFLCSEEYDLEGLENKLREIENINSLEVIDMRRAI